MLQNIFVAIHDFFRKRKAILWLFFLLSFVAWIVLAFRVTLKEDISSMLPDSKAIRAMNDVISHTQAGEQVIFLVSFTDSTYTNADSLIGATNTFTGRLNEQYARWIDTISLQIGQGYEEELVQVFQNNLPVFLNESDFRQLDTLLQPGAINATLAANRKILMSPAGLVYKQMVANDPVAISQLVWRKLKTVQFDPNYELYNGYIFTRDGQLAFFLKPTYKASATGENGKFFGQLDNAIKEWERSHPDMHITYFGGPAVAAGNASQLRTDTIVTLSVTIVLLLTLTYYFFRRKRIPLLLLVPVMYGAAMGMGMVYLVQGSISVIALGAGAIVLCLAIDYSIHFLAHARHAKDIRSTILELAQPLTIGSFTTIAAFLSLRLVHTPILRDLGLFAAVSLMGAALCTLIFLPHFPLGIRKNKAAKETLFDKGANWRPEKQKWLIGFIVLLTPVLLYFSFDVQFDDDLMHLNYLSPQMERAQQEVSSASASALSSVFLIANEQNEDKALQQLETLSTRLDTLLSRGWVRNISNPVLLLPSTVEQQKRIARWQNFWTPDRKQNVMTTIHEAARKNGFAENAFSSFAATIDKNYQPLDTSAVTILKTFFPGSFTFDKDNRYAIAALRVPAEYRRQVFDYLSQQGAVTVTDRQQGATQLVAILNTDFNNIAIYSSFIVFFALLIGYGRIELALIAFLPMAISWVWILGLMSLLGLKFNIVNIVISTLIFGLGDDYTIFTMDGLIERYKHGANKLASVRSAIYLSVVTTIIGLGVLLLAKHPALRSIAGISVTGILCVLLISQTLQPFLFNWFIQNRAQKRLLPFTLWSLSKSLFAYLYFVAGSLLLSVFGIIFTRLWFFNRKQGKYLYHACIRSLTWSMLHIMANVKKRTYHLANTDFTKPAIYIANHTSFLDILYGASMTPRMILLTNKWVWRSPVFGSVVRMAEYYPVINGVEDSIAPMQRLVNEGYSILIFPEGTRSYTDKIGRFHKGAFYLAAALHLDIVPVVLHGYSNSIQKGDWLLKDAHISSYIYPRISPDSTEYGNTYSERAKLVGRWMRQEYAAIKERNETPKYFKERLVRSYLYKGPVLEWYCRVKIKLENYYEPFHMLIPRSGVIYDLGCGYGFMTYMLHWASPERAFTGVDYDEEKIATAQHNFLKDDAINFACADITMYQLQPCDCILISDVLHYLLPEQQERVLEKCIAALNAGGRLIIRDGVSELEQRHKGTKLTEVFSTKIFAFNKTQNKLHFISRAFIEQFAQRHGLALQVIDNTRHTSNLIFILDKN